MLLTQTLQIMGKLLCLSDKNGTPIPDDSIIFGKVPGEGDDEHYWNLGFSPNDGSFEMIACTWGYVHNVQPTHLVDCVLIGSVDEFGHLLECD